MPPPEPRITHALPQDIPAMVGLLGDLFSIEQGFRVDPERQRRGLCALLEAPDHAIVLVARAPGTEHTGGMSELGPDIPWGARGGRRASAASERSSSFMAVGMVTLQILVSTAEGGAVGLVEDLVIAPEWRGQGLGGALLAELRRLALLRGLTRLQLLADQENTPALGFYGRQGWNRTEMICLRQPLTPCGDEGL